MMAARTRRIVAGLGFLILSVVYGALHWAYEQSFQDATKYSGILLFAILIFLMAFSVRKRLSFLPLLPASVWLRVHSYLGLFSMVVFVGHNGFSIPQGGLELVLAIFFVITSISGIWGLWLSRAVPSRLTAHGENLNFERIPELCRNLRLEAEALILSSAEDTDSSTLADFYQANLARYFSKLRFRLSDLFGPISARSKRLERMDSLKRYLSDEEERILDELMKFVQAKENLDLQWYLQGLLKLWLFVHVPLSFALILLAVTHVALVWQFL